MPRGHRRGQKSQREALATALGLPDATDRTERTVIFSKTKMCKFHILGMCTKGEGCKFAHHKDELNPLPDLSRTKLCKTLISTGSCEDPQCKYAHNREELRGIPEAAAAAEHEHEQQLAAALGRQIPAMCDAQVQGLNPVVLAYLASVPPSQVEQVMALQQHLQALQRSQNAWAAQSQSQPAPPQPVSPEQGALALSAVGQGQPRSKGTFDAPARRGGNPGRGAGAGNLPVGRPAWPAQAALPPAPALQQQPRPQPRLPAPQVGQPQAALQQPLWPRPCAPGAAPAQPPVPQAWWGQPHLENEFEDSEEDFSPLHAGGLLAPAELPMGQDLSREEEGGQPTPVLVVKNTFYDFENNGQQRVAQCPRPSTWAGGLNLLGHCASQDSMVGAGDASPGPGQPGEAEFQFPAAVPAVAGSPTVALPSGVVQERWPQPQGTGLAAGMGLSSVPERHSFWSRKVSEESETSTEVPPCETEKRLQDTPMALRELHDEVSNPRSNLSTLDEEEAGAGSSGDTEKEGHSGGHEAKGSSGGGCAPVAGQAPTGFIVKNTFIEIGEDLAEGPPKHGLRTVQTAAGRLDAMG